MSDTLSTTFIRATHSSEEFSGCPLPKEEASALSELSIRVGQENGGQAPKTGTARRVLCIIGTCPPVSANDSTPLLGFDKALVGAALALF